MGHAAVDDVRRVDAALDCAQGALDLRQHAALQRAVGDQALGILAREAGQRGAAGVEDAGGVREQHQLARLQAFGDGAGHEVRVDVVGLAVGADADRRDHRHEAAADERVEQAAMHRFNLPHVADVDDLRGCALARREGELAGADQVGVLAADAHGAPAGGVQERDDVLVDKAAEHHLHDVHGGGVGDAHAVHEAGGNVQAVQQIADLRPAAVDDDGVHAHQLEQHHVAGEGALQVLGDHGVAAVLDDDRGAVEAPDVGQRLGENPGDAGVVVHCRHDATASWAALAAREWNPSASSTPRKAASKIPWMRCKAAASSASKRSVSAGLVLEGRTRPQPSS